MANLGVPAFLDSGCLPTKLSIFNHYLMIREEGLKEGRWKFNTPISDICKAAIEDVKTQWEKTEIPTFFKSNPRKALRWINDIVTDAKLLLKIPTERRSELFGSEMLVLLDMAVCQHPDLETCCCAAGSRVPAAWMPILQGQRGPRLQVKMLTRQSLSLRNAKKLKLTYEEEEEVKREKKREERQAKEEEQRKSR